MRRSEYQALTERDHEKHATYIVSVMCRERWLRVGGMRGSRQSRTRHLRQNPRSGGGIWCG